MNDRPVQINLAVLASERERWKEVARKKNMTLREFILGAMKEYEKKAR